MTQHSRGAAAKRDEELVELNLSVPTQVRERLEKLAREANVNNAELVQLALDGYERAQEDARANETQREQKGPEKNPDRSRAEGTPRLRPDDLEWAAPAG